jgi:hypothetical protein
MTAPYGDELITRAQAWELYDIDSPCYVIKSYGNFPKELIKIERDTRKQFQTNRPPYDHLRDACKRILNINHGSESYGVNCIILLPLFIRINSSRIINQELTAEVECYPSSMLQNISISVFGNGSFSYSSTEFESLDNDGKYQIRIPIGNQDWLLIKLFHGTDLLEEYAERRNITP